MLAAKYPCSCVWGASNALTLSMPIYAIRGKLRPSVRALALSCHHPGLFLVVLKYESTQRPRGWNKPRLQVRDEIGAQICHHAHKTHTSSNTAKFHKCTVTQWLHLEAISGKSTQMM